MNNEMFKIQSNVDFMTFLRQIEFAMFLFVLFFKVQDCHVIKYLSKEEYDGRTAALVVGGKNVSPFYVRTPDD